MAGLATTLPTNSWHRKRHTRLTNQRATMEEIVTFYPPSRRGEGKFLGMEGITILIPLLAFGLGAVCFALKSQLIGPGTNDLLIFMVAPPILGTLYVLLLVSGKPKNYDRDLFIYAIQRVVEALGLEGDPFFARPRKKKK